MESPCLKAPATWGLHDRGRRAASLFHLYPAFALQLRKGMEKLSQGTWLVFDIIVVSHVAFFRAASTGLLIISPPRLPVGDFSRPLVDISAFQVAEIS
jgi:hypothetical protein